MIDLLFIFVVLFFKDRVSLYSPGYPRTQSVDEAGLEIRDPRASASSAGIEGLHHYTQLILLFKVPTMLKAYATCR